MESLGSWPQKTEVTIRFNQRASSTISRDGFAVPMALSWRNPGPSSAHGPDRVAPGTKALRPFCGCLLIYVGKTLAQRL